MFLVTVLDCDVTSNCDGRYVRTHPCSWYCVWIQNVLGPDVSVVLGWKVFGEIIREICKSTFPSDFELFLSVFFPKPRFGAFLSNVVVGERGNRRIVGDDGSCWLRVAKGGEYMAYGYCYLSVVKDAGGFGFSGRGNNMTECFALYKDGRAEIGGVVCAKGEVPCDATTGFGCDEVRCIGVHL